MADGEGLAGAIPGVGLGLGLIGSIGKLFGNARANRGLRKLESEDPNYQFNPLANQRLGLAQTILNAKMPGSATIERGIYGNQANTVANYGRGATDSSQFLTGVSGVQGQTNEAFRQEGLDQNDYYKWGVGNLNQAQEGAINEGDKVFGDQVRRFQDKGQIQGAINANRQNTWGSISNGGFALADFGMNGGFGGKRQTPERF